MIADLLAGLSEEEIQAIGDGSSTIDLEANSRLFMPGDPATSLYIVYSGEVEILPEGMSPENRGVLLGPGEFFGEISLIEGCSHNSTAVTTKPTSLLELHWETFEHIMNANPTLLHNLNRALAERLRNTDRRLIKALTIIAEENSKLYGRVSSALEVSKEVGDMLDWSELWKRLLDKALVTFNAERGTVYIVNQATNILEGMVIRGAGLSKITLKQGQGIAGSCAITSEAILVDDAQEDPRFLPDFDALTGFSTRAVICAPFKDGAGKLLGVIQLISSRANIFTADDLACLSLFADQLALGYERAHSAHQLVSRAEEKIANEIIVGVKEALPTDENGNTNTRIERLFARFDLAYNPKVEYSPKPVRFKTFIERLVQEISTCNTGIEILIGREQLYEGFVTVDSNFLSAVIEGLLLDLTQNQEKPVIISGIDIGEALCIKITNGITPNRGSNRQSISFQAAQKMTSSYGGAFKAGNSTENSFTVTLLLPLAG